jgi:hypothetical protein
MKDFHKDQRGVGHIIGIVLLLVIVGVAAIGYRVAQTSDANTVSDTATPAAVIVPSKIQSTADVKKADRALDNSGIDGSVDPSSLDNDINSLL